MLVYILVILIMSGLAWERHLQLELPQTLFAACGGDFILNFKRNAGLESISDEIQIRTVFFLSTYYVAQSAIAISMSQVTSRVLS